MRASGPIDLPTFSKQGKPWLIEFPSEEELILTDVATDGRILATALGAADAGRHVSFSEAM